MWIAILIWFVVIVAVLVAILLLARAESHDEKFSASIPDGQEYDERRARMEEERRGSARIVAPGIVIQPSERMAPGVTEQPTHVPDHPSQEMPVVKPVVATSSRVVEVKGILQPRRPVNPVNAVVAPTSASASAHTDGVAPASAEQLVDPHLVFPVASPSPDPISAQEETLIGDFSAAALHPVKVAMGEEGSADPAQETESETEAVSATTPAPAAGEVTQVGMRLLKEENRPLPVLPLPARTEEREPVEDSNPAGSASLAHLVSKTEAKESGEE